MALSYPLSLAAFQDRAKITVAEFVINNPRQISRTAGGSQLSASLGDSVWRGSFETPPTNVRAETAAIDALLSVLDRAGSSFLVYDPSKPYPADDLTGSITGSATVTIRSLSSSDARVMALNGLPNGFSLRAGDLIGWTYGSSPTRYALHRLVEDASGTDAFEVTPFIQPGASAGAAVTLIKPVMKAVLLPNPGFGSHRAVISSGKQFSFVQTLR
jgi:hypothetical protein